MVKYKYGWAPTDSQAKSDSRIFKKEFRPDFDHLQESHKDDLFSVSEDNTLEDFLQIAEETASSDSEPEQAAMAFICKRLKLKNPKHQRGRKQENGKSRFGVVNYETI